MDPREVAASLVEDAKPISPPETAEPEEQVTTDDAEDTADALADDQLEDAVEDPEDEPEEADPEGDDADIVTLKIDGEEVEVTFDELVQSYQIDGAAKKRLQEATEARKAAAEQGRLEGLEAAKAEIQTQRQEVETARQQLAELVGVVGQNLFTPQVERPDPAMEATDPIGYLTAMEKWREDQQRIHGLQQQMVQVTEAQRAEAQKQKDRLMSENRMRLIQQRPDLRQPEAQQKFTQNVRRAQEFAGFSREEVDNFPDYRGVLALDKLGELLSTLQGEGPTPAQKVVQKARKPLAPGAASYKRNQSQKKRRAERDRAKQTGDYRDIAKLLVEDVPRKR